MLNLPYGKKKIWQCRTYIIPNQQPSERKLPIQDKTSLHILNLNLSQVLKIKP